MANPRNKAGAKSTDTKEQDMTDTTTDEAVTEVADVPSEPSTAEAAPAAEAAAPKAVIDHEGNLFDAIVAFASSEDENKVATLQGAYRAVPAAARGKVQGVAMKRAMTEGSVDMDVLGNVLDAFNNLPTVTKSARVKENLPPEVAGAIRLAALMVAYPAAQTELGDEADAQARVWYKDGVPAEHLDTVLRLATQAIKSLDKGGRGGGGDRVQMTEKMKDLLDRGVITAGAELTGAGGVTASVNEDGTISTNGETYPNPSAAARIHRIKDGKPVSTNGWDFWQFEGKSVGDLRIK